MSQVHFPTAVDARKLCEQGATIEGRLPQSDFQRVADRLLAPLKDIDVTLTFALGDQGLLLLSGQLSGEVNLLCERCLEPAVVDIDSEFSYAIVASDEQAKLLAKELEPIISTAVDTLALIPIIEDELILSLPMYAYHDHQCVEMEQAEADTVKETSPFAVLAALKSNKNAEEQS